VARRDRKRSKQRQQRRPAAAPAPSQPVRANLPGQLDHASGEVDEFDAALVRGAQGAPGVLPEPVVPERGVSDDATDLEDRKFLEEDIREFAAEDARRAAEPGEEAEEGLDEEELALADEGEGAGGGGARVAAELVPGGGAARPAAPRAKQSLRHRAVAFLRASWAELQRVQWPDRRQVAQATAVVLGFVAIAGVYLGVADYVAKKIVDAIL
jgi:preprotein translocase subunit SecE